jgi:hypothetical protein
METDVGIAGEVRIRIRAGDEGVLHAGVAVHPLLKDHGGGDGSILQGRQGGRHPPHIRRRPVREEETAGRQGQQNAQHQR